MKTIRPKEVVTAGLRTLAVIAGLPLLAVVALLARGVLVPVLAAALVVGSFLFFFNERFRRWFDPQTSVEALT